MRKDTQISSLWRHDNIINLEEIREVKIDRFNDINNIL